MNPFTTGNPLFGGRLGPTKRRFPYCRVKYHCKDCGYKEKYDDRYDRWEATKWRDKAFEGLLERCFGK